MSHILEFLAVYIFAFGVHESSHVVVAYLFGIEVKGFRFSWKGLPGCIVRDSGPPFDNMLVSLAGPFVNLSFAFIVFGMPGMHNFVLMNFCYGFFNLLPFKGSDGQRAAECWRKIERAPEEIRNDQIIHGARGCGKTDVASEMMFAQAEKFLRENVSCVWQVWVISHSAAEAMHQRFKLAGFDMSRIQISISGEQLAKTQSHLPPAYVALHNKASQRSAGDD